MGEEKKKTSDKNFKDTEDRGKNRIFLALLLRLRLCRNRCCDGRIEDSIWNSDKHAYNHQLSYTIRVWVLFTLKEAIEEGRIGTRKKKHLPKRMQGMICDSVCVHLVANKHRNKPFDLEKSNEGEDENETNGITLKMSEVESFFFASLQSIANASSR